MTRGTSRLLIQKSPFRGYSDTQHVRVTFTINFPAQISHSHDIEITTVTAITVGKSRQYLCLRRVQELIALRSSSVTRTNYRSTIDAATTKKVLVVDATYRSIMERADPKIQRCSQSPRLAIRISIGSKMAIIPEKMKYPWHEVTRRCGRVVNRRAEQINETRLGCAHRRNCKTVGSINRRSIRLMGFN